MGPILSSEAADEVSVNFFATVIFLTVLLYTLVVCTCGCCVARVKFQPSPHKPFLLLPSGFRVRIE